MLQGPHGQENAECRVVHGQPQIVFKIIKGPDSGCLLIEPYSAVYAGEDSLKADGAERIVLQWICMSRAAQCQDRQQQREPEDPEKRFHTGKKVAGAGDCKYPVDRAHITLLPG